MSQLFGVAFALHSLRWLECKTGERGGEGKCSSVSLNQTTPTNVFWTSRYVIYQRVSGNERE
jgi:hypothetical protein